MWHIVIHVATSDSHGHILCAQMSEAAPMSDDKTAADSKSSTKKKGRMSSELKALTAAAVHIPKSIPVSESVDASWKIPGRKKGINWPDYLIVGKGRLTVDEHGKSCSAFDDDGNIDVMGTMWNKKDLVFLDHEQKSKNPNITANWSDDSWATQMYPELKCHFSAIVAYTMDWIKESVDTAAYLLKPKGVLVVIVPDLQTHNRVIGWVTEHAAFEQVHGFKVAVFRRKLLGSDQ